MTTYTDQLVAAVDQAAGTKAPIDMSKWFNYYSFDIMGDMAFGKTFGMLLNGEDTYFLKALHADMTGVGIFGRLQWLFPFFKSVPGLNGQYLRFWDFLDAQVAERIKVCPGWLQECRLIV